MSPTEARSILTFRCVVHSTRGEEPPNRDAGILLLLLAVLGFALFSKVRYSDELGAASWIEARHSAAGIQTAGFVTRFVFPFDIPSAELKLLASGSYQAFFDGVLIGEATVEAKDRLDIWSLEGPIAAGAHQILVVVGAGSERRALRLRAALDGVRLGRNCVVTDATWRVGDDAKTLRERGFDGARYPAAVSFTSAIGFDSISASSRSRSWRGSAVISARAFSSRMPSRATTQ